jgi:hypothetical protein
MELRPFLTVFFAATALAQVRGPAPEVRNVYDPEHPGTWTVVADFVTPSPRTFGATAAQTNALSARIAALAEVIHRTPLLNAPRGVEVRARARYYPYEAWFTASGSCTNYEAACSKFPLMADLTVTLFNFFHLSNSVPPKIITHIEDNSDALFYVNILSQARGAAAGDMSAMPDGRPTGMKPLEIARVAGFPVYKR